MAVVKDDVNPSETPPTGRTSRGRYHHGDLPAVLTDTAIELIAEHGVHGFSLAEAARRAGVSVGAPYRHFPDKESLLAAVGVRAYAALRPRLDAAVASASAPAEQLTAAATAYVRFAAEEPALFSTLFGAGIHKSRFPELTRASVDAYGSWLEAARALTSGGDDESATELAVDVLTIAHGHAALLQDGQFGDAVAALPEVEIRTHRVVSTFLAARATGAPVSTARSRRRQ